MKPSYSSLLSGFLPLMRNVSARKLMQKGVNLIFSNYHRFTAVVVSHMKVSIKD